ncbi:MAG: histidinol dehydrogenase, partial [Lachnospiraceae bacterium]|nr:histidinol dehydrogenase [Lachnospiraceae bacterium]
MKILKKAQERTAADDRALRDTVTGIIDNVCANGDAALREYNRTFDGCGRECLRVSREEIKAAYAQLTEQELSDLKEARANIEAFAQAQ